MKTPGHKALTLALGTALLAHLGLGLLRIPKKAWLARIAEVRRYEREGPVRFHLKVYGEESIRAIERVLEESPPASVVLFRGEWRGPLEFAPALLHPRLVVREHALPPGATSYHGRPLARDPEGVFVLVGRSDRILLERR